jgi:hypothetical protein
MGFYIYRHCQSLNSWVFKQVAFKIENNRKMTTSQHIKENLVRAKMIGASLKRVEEVCNQL